MENQDIIFRLLEAIENQNSAPQWELIISILALAASWITIAFLLKERQEKSRPYLQISFELVRSTLACIVLKNTGNSALEVKSLKFNENFIAQLKPETQTRLKNKECTNIAIFPNRQWVISFEVNVFDIIGKFEEKSVTIEYTYSKLGKSKKTYPPETVTIDFEEYKGILVYISDLDEFKNSVDHLNNSVKKLVDTTRLENSQRERVAE